jgi:hypothetical protein
MGSRWKLIAAFVSLFLIGGLCGSVITLGVTEGKRGHRGFTRDSSLITNRIVKRLNRVLELTPEQKEAIVPQIVAAVAQMRAVRTNALRQNRDILDAAYAKIEAQLPPAQQKKMQRFRERRRERVGRMLEDRGI